MQADDPEQRAALVAARTRYDEAIANVQRIRNAHDPESGASIAEAEAAALQLALQAEEEALLEYCRVMLVVESGPLGRE